MLLQLISLYVVPFLSITAALPTDQKPLLPHVLQSVLQVRAELRKAEIIPTVIDDFIPSLTVAVSWKKQSASLGNTLNVKHVQSTPSIKLHDETNTNPDNHYTTNMTYVVTLTDPDAPSRDNPEWSEMCHWIASGVHLSGPEGDGDENDDLHEVMEWKAPGPPPKTGKHRYVFLVFAPSNMTTLPLNLTKPKDRQHWGTGEERKGVRQWAEENGLMPVAANFIYAQNKKQ